MFSYCYCFIHAVHQRSVNLSYPCSGSACQRRDALGLTLASMTMSVEPSGVPVSAAAAASTLLRLDLGNCLQNEQQKLSFRDEKHVTLYSMYTFP